MEEADGYGRRVESYKMNWRSGRGSFCLRERRVGKRAMGTRFEFQQRGIAIGGGEELKWTGVVARLDISNC